MLFLFVAFTSFMSQPSQGLVNFINFYKQVKYTHCFTMAYSQLNIELSRTTLNTLYLHNSLIGDLLKWFLVYFRSMINLEGAFIKNIKTIRDTFKCL